MGQYPCCDGDLWIGLPDGLSTPAFLPESCPHCGVKVWHVFSRVDPMTYVEADFLALYDVDEASRTIKPKAA